MIIPGLLTFLVLPHVIRADPPDTSAYHALRLADGTCLDDHNLGAFECEEVERQRWKLTPVANGYYAISPEERGSTRLKQCLDMAKDDGDVANKARVRLQDCENVPSQHWKFSPADDAFSITNEARGDRNCLAIVDYAAKLVGCANVSGQHWKFNRDSIGAGPKIDGETAIPSPFDPTFIMLFLDKGCPELPGADGVRGNLFECARTGKKTATCTIRSIVGDDELADLRGPRQHALDMTIVTDTSTAMKLVTPNGAIQVNNDLKKSVSTLIQKSPPRRPKCIGRTFTAEVWKDVQQQIRDKEAAEYRATPSAPSTSAPHSVAPAPAPAAHKGLEHGRMCGRDSECESGSCKMENKTRGRCS